MIFSISEGYWEIVVVFSSSCTLNMYANTLGCLEPPLKSGFDFLLALLLLSANLFSTCLTLQYFCTHLTGELLKGRVGPLFLYPLCL